MRRWLIALVVCLCATVAATAEGAPASHAAKKKKPSIPAVGRYGGGPRDAPNHQYEFGIYVAKIHGKSQVSVGAWIKADKLTCQPGPFTANGGAPFVQKFFGLKLHSNRSFKGSVNVFGLINTVSGHLTRKTAHVTVGIQDADLGHTCTGTFHFNVRLKKQKSVSNTPI